MTIFMTLGISIKECVKKTLSFVFSWLLSHFLIFSREILGEYSPIYWETLFKKFMISQFNMKKTDYTEKKIEFSNLPASYKRMQCNVSNWPDSFLNNFNSFNYHSTKLQIILTNIMANHQLKFHLDVLTCHEGIKVLLENLLTLRYIPTICNSHIS